jgi:hypothetical protein
VSQDVRDCLTIAVGPALSLLPPKMDTAAARAMLVAIALQESDLDHRRQRPGPARGYWQFERGNSTTRAGVYGVLTHPQTAALARETIVRLDYEPSVSVVHEAIEDNDVLACVFARLLLWTLPVRLPQPAETELAWKQYLDAWRPGRPHPERWPSRYALAWCEIGARP